MNKPITAVLGCGPSGLIAAYTLEMYGIPTVIISKKQKSLLGGAQFSHIAVPGLCDDADIFITYHVRGDAETYQRKVYGSNEVPFVSFDNVKDGMTVPAWNLRKMYDLLWERYEGRIVDYPLDGPHLSTIAQGFELVFSSMPAPVVCMGTPVNSHWFRQQTIRIFNGLVGAQLHDALEVHNNTITYDGTEEVNWYRQSRIFGVDGTEWGTEAPLPPLPDIRTINKPIGTNCDCHPDVHRIGRFGTWQKGVLTHQAYDTVREVLHTDWGIEL